MIRVFEYVGFKVSRDHGMICGFLGLSRLLIYPADEVVISSCRSKKDETPTESKRRLDVPDVETPIPDKVQHFRDVRREWDERSGQFRNNGLVIRLS